MTATTCTWDWWLRNPQPGGRVNLMTWPTCEPCRPDVNPPRLMLALPRGKYVFQEKAGGNVVAQFRAWVLSCLADEWPAVEFRLPDTFAAGWTVPRGTDGAYTPSGTPG